MQQKSKEDARALDPFLFLLFEWMGITETLHTRVETCDTQLLLCALNSSHFIFVRFSKLRSHALKLVIDIPALIANMLNGVLKKKKKGIKRKWKAHFVKERTKKSIVFFAKRFKGFLNLMELCNCK